jgi:quinoprotein glucose dehydrogenase
MTGQHPARTSPSATTPGKTMIRLQVTRLVAGVLSGAIVAGCAGDGRREYSHAATWEHYLGDPGRTHFSSLDRIDTTNVHRLAIAWEYASGGLQEGAFTEIQHNPLIVDSVLYGTNASLGLFAVDARTGREIWALPLPADGGRSRGLMRWEAAGGGVSRIYTAAGPRLYAVRPEDGSLDRAFGDSGHVDLRVGLDRDPETISVYMNTPGAVFEDLLIVGSAVDERPGAAPGTIRAYHARTGRLEWTFRTIPLPGEPGDETWPGDAYLFTGGANSWAGMSVDLERGIVFVPTGSAAYDFYGGDRIGDNLYANSLLALDARTGRLIWHQQLVRHDVWDRDLPAPPNLVTVEHGGELVPAVAQITKDAHVWVFQRETGEPLFPVRELDVPPSLLIGERTAARQRLPASPAPFARQRLTADMLYRPDHPAWAREGSPTVGERFATLTSAGQFAPPDTLGAVIFPGLDGGGEWGGAAVDPRVGVLYVNASEMAWIARMNRVDPGADPALTLFGLNCARCHGGSSPLSAAAPSLVGVGDRLSADSIEAVIRRGRNAMPAHPGLSDPDVRALVAFVRGERAVRIDSTTSAAPIPYFMEAYERFLDGDGKPVVEPPWGTLTAIDLDSGDHLWQVPLGDDSDIDDPAHPVTGIENYGGPVVTAGGLVFIAATLDRRIRAFHAGTGALLWEAELPAGGFATPATYEVDGRQYVVIACGGGKRNTRSGDRYVAFALPGPS